MRRILSLFTMLMLCGVLAFGQSRVVSGTVTDANGKPVPFASVIVKGGGGVQTDVNGSFSIKVNPGDALIISQTSYEEVSVPLGSLTKVNVTLKLKSGDLTEVIVTSAFNTKRTLRSQSSNVQNVSSEQLNTIRQTNVNNALAGKVAGIQVRSQSSAKLGVDNVVRLRGENGIGIGGGALYVVDGTIMPSANDINTDDIEDVTVLQGPSAAALFGPAAAGGAIVINTKKARKNQKGIGLEINTGITFDKVYILPDFQNDYSGGTDGNFKLYNYQPGDPIGWKALDGKYYHDYTEDVSWGPKIAGQEYIPWYAWYSGHERAFKTTTLTRQPNNSRDFFNTGTTALNNFNFSKAGDGFNFRVSYTNQDQKGLIPESYLKKNTIAVNGTVDLGSKLSLTTHINYISQKSNTENDDGYSNNTSGSFNQWFHRDLDIDIMRELRYLRGPNGELATWNHNNPDAYSTGTFYKSYYWYSPFAWQDNVQNTRNRDRVFGDIGLAYKATNALTFKFTYRKQQLDQQTETKMYNALDLSAGTNSGFNYWEAANGRSRTWGGYGIGYSTSNTQNYEFLGIYSKKVKDFDIDVTAGLNIQKLNQSVYNANTLGGLSVPNQFNLLFNVSGVNQTNNIFASKGRALFSAATVGYKKFLYAEGTFRRDYLSTEPTPGYIDTKSLGVSFIFSDFINKGGQTFLSYGKIRASYGQVLNSLGIYQLNQTYTVASQTFAGNSLSTEPNSLIDPFLHGAVNDEKEIGMELRFLKSKISLNATYWSRTNKDFPLAASVSPYTGYSTITTNAGEVGKTGIDLQLVLRLVSSKNLDWRLSANWGKLLTNQVVSINDKLGITEQVTQGSGNGNINLISKVGDRWGQLRGTGIKRNAAGLPIIKADGTYETVLNKYFGSALPDYTGGIQNSFTIFKNFQVDMNIDFSYGGKFFSLSDFYGSSSGLYNNTAGLNDKGIPVRDPVSSGGGLHVVGVDASDKPVDMYVDPRYFYENNGAYGSRIAETAIRDLTFVKLREVSFGYRLPVERMGLSKYLTNATFSILARNPVLLYVNGKGFDPSELTFESGENGQLPGTRGIGVNLKLGF